MPNLPIPPGDPDPPGVPVPQMPVDSPEAHEIQARTLQAAAALRVSVLLSAEQAGQALTADLRQARLLRDDQFAKFQLQVQVNGMLYDAHPLDPDAETPDEDPTRRIVP